jgi:hypothetical protein
MRRRLLITLSMLSFSALAACNDNETTGLGTTATVRFANATNIPVDIATAGTVATGNASIAYGTGSACTALNAIEPDFQVLQAGTLNSLSSSFMPVFLGGNFYVVIAYPGFSGATQYTSVNTTFQPTAGQAGLRVVNLAAGSGAYDVYVSAPGAALGPASVTTIGFGTVSGLINVIPGAQLVRLTNTGTQTVVINAGNYTFTAGLTTVLVIAPPAPGTTALRSFFVAGC